SGVLVALMRGRPEEERDKKSSEKKTKASDETEEESSSPAADATLALVELEILIRGNGGEASPPLGSDVPPAAHCRALLSARSRWMTSAMKSSLHHGLAAGRDAWSQARKRLDARVSVRGRSDGEAASYRLGALVHVPPTAVLDRAAGVLELLGSLQGDRFIEVSMFRVPEQADTFASSTTVAGPLAAERLSDGPEPPFEADEEGHEEETAQGPLEPAPLPVDDEVVDDSEVVEDRPESTRTEPS
ncbi:MAG: hypothetical protein ACOCVR_03830, partial [Myxococcota bacterium]